MCLRGERQVVLLHLMLSFHLFHLFISFLTSFEKYEMSTMWMAAEMVNTVGAERFILLL